MNKLIKIHMYILKNLLIYSGLKALVKRYLKKFKDYFMMLTKINIGVHNWSEWDNVNGITLYFLQNIKIEFYMKLSRNEKEFLNKVTAYIKWGGVVTFLEMNIYWQG